MKDATPGIRAIYRILYRTPEEAESTLSLVAHRGGLYDAKGGCVDQAGLSGAESHFVVTCLGLWGLCLPAVGVVRNVSPWKRERCSKGAQLFLPQHTTYSG